MNKIRINAGKPFTYPAKKTRNNNYLIQKNGYDLYVNKDGKLLSVHPLDDQWEYLGSVEIRDTYFKKLPTKKHINRLASETVQFSEYCFYNEVWDYKNYISWGKQEKQIQEVWDTDYVDGSNKYSYIHSKVDDNFFERNSHSFNIQLVFNAPKNEERMGVKFFTSPIPLA